MSTKSEPVIVGNAGRGTSILVFENKGEKGNYFTAKISRPRDDKDSGETMWQNIIMPADDLLLLADEATRVFRKYKKIKRKK